MSLDTIVDTTNPTQSGLLNNFLSPGSGIDPDLVFNDILLEVSHRPVKPSVTNYRPWDDDFITGDTFQLAVGNPGAAPTAGTFSLGVQRASSKTITAISMANPTHISATAHGMNTGDIMIATGTNSTPVIDGTYYSVTVIDANTFSIPVNVTVAGTAGTFVSFNTSGLLILPNGIPAATLSTALSTVSTTEAYGAVVATLLTNGNYSLAWSTAGAVPLLYSSGSGLLPQSTASVSQIVAGSGTTEALQILQLQQSPVAYCEPATPFPAASIAASIAQHGATALDKIYSIVFTPGTYDGTFSISITNIAAVTASYTANANISTSDLSLALNALPNLAPGDLNVTGSVSGGLSIQFQGAQKNSDVPVLAVANISLQAPLGVSGSLNLNTVNLYIAFSQTTANSLNFTLSIRRTRADGEQSEYFLVPITLKRNLITNVPLVPLALSSYYTAAQVDSFLALKAPLASPAFTGAPTAPTPSTGDNSTKLATTAFSAAAILANGPYVNVVTEFGATGNGTTDDTTSIQNAINTGRTVFFPPGTYKVGGLYPKVVGQIFIGSGRVTCFVPNSGGAHIWDLTINVPTDPISGTGAYYYKWSSFRVAGTQNGSSGSTGAAFFGDTGAFLGDSCTWENIDVTGMGAAWAINGFGNTIFTRCAAQNNNYGLIIGSYSSGTSATGNAFNTQGVVMTDNFLCNIWVKQGVGLEIALGDCNYGGATSAWAAAIGIRIGDNANGNAAFVELFGGNFEAQAVSSGVALKVETSSRVIHSNARIAVGGAVTNPPVLVQSGGYYNMRSVFAANASVGIIASQCAIGGVVTGDGALNLYGTDDAGGGVVAATGIWTQIFDNAIPTPGSATDGLLYQVIPRASQTGLQTRYLLGLVINGTHSLSDIANSTLLSGANTFSGTNSFTGLNTFPNILATGGQIRITAGAIINIGDSAGGLLLNGLDPTGSTTLWFVHPGGTAKFQGLTLASTTLLTTSVSLSDGSASAAGTLLNAPTAGNPTKWISVNDNGTTRFIPAW